MNTKNQINLVENFEIAIDVKPNVSDILWIIKDGFNDIGMESIRFAIDNIGVEWVNENGKITKRLKKYFKKMHSVDLDDGKLSIVGEKIKSHFITSNYQIKIDRGFVWRSGDYNDDGSCFWSFNSHHRAILASPKNDNCFAVKITGDECGRCWLINDENFGVILFNAYGMQLQKIAIILSEKFNLNYAEKYIHISHIWHNGGKIYLLNNDTFSSIDNINLYDLKSEDTYCPICENYFGRNENFNTDDDGIFGCNNCIQGLKCSWCGDPINEDECYYDNNGDPICEYCFSDNYFYCSECGEVFRNDDAKITDSECLCDRCFHDNYIECEKCGDYVKIENAINHDDLDFCQDCFDDNFTYCENCGDYFSNDEIVNHDDDNYCNDCFNELFKKCDFCGDFKDADYFLKIENKNVCSECIENNFYYFDFLNVWQKIN